MARRLFLFFACVFLLLTSREPPWADAHVTYDTTQALVERRALDVTLSGPPQFFVFQGKKKYGVFPLGNVLAMIPSFVVYKVLMRLPGAPDARLFALCSHVSPALLVAGVCALFYELCRRRGATLRWALLLTLALGFSTLCFVYARSPYSEALQTMVLLWLVERTLRQGEQMTAGGMALLGCAAGLLVNAKLVNVLLLPPVAAYLLYLRARARDWKPLVHALPGALAVFAAFVLLALWHNKVKTGSPWDSGYRIPDGVFSGDLGAGLYGLLLSSGKGLFFYSPPLVLGLLGLPTAWRRRRAETLLLLSLIALCTLYNAKFRHWHADYCWGPRHLTAVTPLLLLLALPWLPEAMARGHRRLRQLGLGALLALGLFVQQLGANVYWDHYLRILITMKDQTGASGWFQEQLGHAHYLPPFSPLVGHYWLLKHLAKQDPNLWADAPWRELVPQPVSLDDSWSRVRGDWWVFEWFGPGGSFRSGSLILALLFGGAVAGGYSIALASLATDDQRRLSRAPALQATDPA